MYQNRVLGLCEKQRDGITNDIIRNQLGLTDVKLQSRVINKLLADEKITIHQKGSALLYKLNLGGKSKNDEEKIVLSIIENASNKGIWTKDIQFKTYLFFMFFLLIIRWILND